MTGHVFWPEGQPDKARHADDEWHALRIGMVMRLKQTFAFRNGRRIREASSSVDVDPHDVERRLMRGGAVKPPPGGWPEDDGVPLKDMPDLFVRTHSII